MNKVFIGAALIATAVFAAVPAQADTLDTMRAAGKVVAGYANTSPFSYLDPKGELTGQAIELARTAFGNMGLGTVDGILIDFPGLIPALQAGQFDVIAASMAIRPARCEQILFSDPYSAVRMVLVHKNSVQGSINSFEELAKSGASLGVQSGAVEVQVARDAGVQNIIEFPDLAAVRDGVRVGRADVMVTITTQVADTLKVLGSNFAAGEPFAPMVNGKPQVNFQAFGFRKGDEALRDAFNAEVKTLRDSGKLAEIFAPFGFNADDIALGASQTAEQLCKP